ncbi:uncharacterized protein N7483_008411 [Penicillium malachiteum]|uniref:uncharacterized protein n=1 Tax=Penicillium malachiteum TaxID=1324776 RepID=UPI0025482578|nr:uncharacterized protein N7483_008411 [Penicillium malachiteum]KAJ5720477.1 hypothetical protein N7483_008411 [Penicillium malachiteum]
MYPTQAFRMQPSRAFFNPAPKEAHSAHTISQRLRMIKKCPPRVDSSRVALGAAFYASTKKLMTDKTLRLYRNSPESREH